MVVPIGNPWVGMIYIGFKVHQNGIHFRLLVSESAPN